MAETPHTSVTSPHDSSLGEGIGPANSKLSPLQQEQVRSPDFIEWFGDWQADPEGPDTSKIIDPESGEPKVFYHGTNRQFDLSEIRPPSEHELSNVGLDHDKAGVYLTENEDMARQYADPLGTEFKQTLGHVARQLGAQTWQDAFEGWNAMVTSIQSRDGRVSISESTTGEETDVAGFSQQLEKGGVSFTSSIKFDGKTVMLVGEFLQLTGGKFPNPENELVGYESLFPEAQRMLGAYAETGGKLLIPEYAQARIIPVFVKSLKPTVIKTSPEHSFDGMKIDHCFADGFDVISDNPEAGYDSVVVDSADTPFGVNMAVLDAGQLREVQAS